MGDIKFRAWYSGEMYENCVVVDGKALRRGHFATDLFSNFSERAKLMQFTGLADVNGVDVYEGDIIEDEDHFYSVVRWNEKCLSWFADGEHLGDYDSGMINVIGNIHQNPELINA